MKTISHLLTETVMRGITVSPDVMHDGVKHLIEAQLLIDDVDGIAQEWGPTEYATRIHRMAGVRQTLHALGISSPQMVRYAYARWGQVQGSIVARALGFDADTAYDWQLDWEKDYNRLLAQGEQP